MALWIFVLLLSVSRHYNQPYSSEQHHKIQQGSLSLSAPPSLPHVHHSALTRVRRPLQFVWTASSRSKLIKAENSPNTR